MYHLVCVAGTFDGIHAGHEALLLKAFEVGSHVLIGITSEKYISLYKSPRLRKEPKVRTYDERKHQVVQWLYDHGYFSRATIVPIDDPYEPVVSRTDIDALIVSEETKARGEEINTKRAACHLLPLVLIVVPVVTTAWGAKISSSDRLTLPPSLRGELSLPFGPFGEVKTHDEDLIITIGDYTTKSFLEKGIVPHLMIIDHQVERKPFPDIDVLLAPHHLPVIPLKSGPGYISKSAMEALTPLPRGVIDVDGEEDLLVLPVLCVAPFGARVYYGQPNQGMVEVVVTEETKKMAAAYLSRFFTT